MNTDNKVLADVQPGGMVRLGDQAERAQFEAWALENNFAATKWPDGAYIEEPMRLAWKAWQHLSARPSRGGQVHGEESCEKIEAELQFYREEAFNLPNILIGAGVSRVDHDGDYRAAWANIMDSIERLAARQPVRIYGCCAQPEGELHTDDCPTLRHLAAPQPVQFERAVPTRRRESAVELLLQLGFVWNNQRWEDRRQPVGQKPVASVEFINGHAAELVYTGAAMPDGQHELYAAPPAQAVDLGQFVPAERPLDFLKMATYHEAIGWNECRRSMLALIDSKAVGK